MRARQLDPALGRFLSVDPIQPGGPSTTGWNHYTYAGANPTTWTDPTGQDLIGYAATAEQNTETTRRSAGPTGLVTAKLLLLLAGAFQLGECIDQLMGDIVPGLCGAVFGGGDDAGGEFEQQIGELPRSVYEELARSMGRSVGDLETCASRGRSSPECEGFNEAELDLIFGIKNGFYSAYRSGNDGLEATLDDDGTLGLYVQRGPDTPYGDEMFDEAMNLFGSSVTQIRGEWNAIRGIDRNYVEYWQGIAAGLSQEEAAAQTWTGQQAARYGFNDVTVDDGKVGEVTVIFGRG